jgi:hypothetical protein
MARRASRRDGPDQPPSVDAARAARTRAQARVRRRGLVYRALLAVTGVMKLDLVLFGRVPSGPFFAVLRKVPR